MSDTLPPFSPGDRVRLDSWAPSQALDNLGVQEEPPPGAEGYVISVGDDIAGTRQIDIWWDDRGARGGHQPGRSVLVCYPGDRISVCGQPHAIAAKVAQLDDEELEKELSFARGFGISGRDDFEGALWLHALEHRKEHG